MFWHFYDHWIDYWCYKVNLIGNINNSVPSLRYVTLISHFIKLESRDLPIYEICDRVKHVHWGLEIFSKNYRWYLDFLHKNVRIKKITWLEIVIMKSKPKINLKKWICTCVHITNMQYSASVYWIAQRCCAKYRF